MPDTARFLDANLKDKNKTIVFTGSMLPMQEFAMSDGAFNLGFAVAQALVLKPGIYVAMNGKVFTPQEVIKELSEGRFSSIVGEGGYKKIEEP